MGREEKTRGEDAIQPEISFETMSDEFFKFMSGMMAKNAKRTYDVYQDLDLDRARISNVHFSNMVENANLASKQAIRHSEGSVKLSEVLRGVVADIMADMADDEE